MFDFITENEIFQENFDRIKQCFVEDFIKQLKRIMQKSEIYKTEKKICKNLLIIKKKDTKKKILYIFLI